MIHDLLNRVRNRSRRSLIEARTEPGGERLRIDGKRSLAADAASQARVRAILAQAEGVAETPKFFKVLDIARRIGGVGSLGLEGCSILVEGRGGTEGPFLLDLKVEPASSLQSYLTLPQPAWPSEATRVVAVQSRGQAIALAFLTPLERDGRSHVLPELMPTSDSLSLQSWNGRFARLESVLESMGRLVAWSHLRSSGWQGAAILDEWIAFGGDDRWPQPLLDYARGYAKQVGMDWQAFREAWASGEFEGARGSAAVSRRS